MSSLPEYQQPSSSQFVPPKSAQPFRSIFGGPSSDVGPLSSSQPEPAQRSIFGGPSKQDDASEPGDGADLMDLGVSEADDEDEDELNMIMRERPLGPEYGSDGESYDGSTDGDEPAAMPVKREQRRSRTRSQSSAINASMPISYVVDRGLDLPPGVERPNRWTGNATTYRRITAHDRGAYDGLVEARARDLSAHLYNSYVLRSQNNGAASLSFLDAGDNEGQERFTVPKHWGAWPLSASRVPRPDETARRILDDPETLRAPSDLRPSAELEESIIACMMKDAKDTFRSQECDYEEEKAIRPRRTEAAEPVTDDEDQKEAGTMNEASRLRPVLQADDDKTRHQLRPLARNVISQLERVLTGLHHSTYSRGQYFDSSDDLSSDTDPDVSRSRSPRKVRGRSRSRGRASARRKTTSRGGSRSAHSSTGPENEDEAMRDASQSRGRSRASDNGPNERTAKSKSRIALRDWSEVMGIASMIGLPAAAVMRASNRCADLFGQDMTFRTFREGHLERGARLPDSTYEYHFAESESEVTDSPTPARIRPRKRKGHSRERSPSQAKRSRSQPARTPTPAVPSSPNAAATPVPGPSHSAAHEMSSPQKQREPASRRKGRGEHRKADLVCPLLLCPRHTDGFSRVWNLNLHMKRMHPGYDPQERERSRSRSRSRSAPGPSQEVIEISD